MPFQKGHKINGNPNGRPKGSENKETKELREKLALLLDDMYPKFLNEMAKLEGIQFINSFSNFLEYCTPKLNRTDLSNNGKDFDFSNTSVYDAITGLDKLLELARSRAAKE